MRVLRSSSYTPLLEPVTIVIRDSDVTDTLESIRVGSKDASRETFIAYDLFDCEDGIIEKATAFAMIRMEERAEDEKNMALQFYWVIRHFDLVSEEGLIAMPAPAPLSVEQIKTVFEQIVMHPRYTQQSVTGFASDNTPVHIEKGEVR